jgi:hypothetical protein
MDDVFNGALKPDRIILTTGINCYTSSALTDFEQQFSFDGTTWRVRHRRNGRRWCKWRVSPPYRSFPGPWAPLPENTND